jgi:chloride channel 7
MGCFGGLMGALWNFMNIQLMLFRERFLKKKVSRVVEAVLVACLSATLACAMMYFISDCRPLEDEPNSNQLQMFCEDNQYNAVARLWFQTPEASVKALFHDPIETHRIQTLMVFVPIYFLLSCLTYGLNVSLGIFIPCLLVGAAWGRLIALLMTMAFPGAVCILENLNFYVKCSRSSI